MRPCREGKTFLACAAAVGVLLATWPAAAVDAPYDRLSILAPGSRGGGWDQTGRAMEKVLEETGLVRDVTVDNSPGAGGAIGLAQFVNAPSTGGDSLLVGGLVMISSIRATGATVSLAQTLPVARLAGDYEVIAVPADSEFADLVDLVQTLRANPGAVAWGGGSIGGADHLLLNDFARAIGIEPIRMNYIAFSGGGEVAEALLRQQISIGISGYGELGPHIESRRLRGLATSSGQRLRDVAVPTLREQGYNVTLTNWRGLFARSDISDEQRRRLQGVIEAMVTSDAWRETLRRHRWTDLYLPGDAFVRFLVEEEGRVASGPDPRGTRTDDRAVTPWTKGQWLIRNRYLLALLGLVGVVLAVVLAAWQRSAASRRERDLSHRLEEAEEQYRRRSAETQQILAGLSDQIDRQFAKWGLTAAESEIAILMLKGLRHKGIASLRGTSERTVRQQALTIYKKAGLDGRTDLAAFFIEDLLQPISAAGHHTA